MIKKIALLSLVALSFSCSKKTGEEEKPPSDPFFNLKTGNLWVYKEYQSDANGVLQFTHKIDSVSVPGDTLIAGNTYFKILHEETGHQLTRFYWREDSGGHLVDETGIVMHPGTDKTYYTSQFNGNGTIYFHLLDPVSNTVEGNEYYTYTYHGDYVPLDPEASHEYIERAFQQHLGMVTTHVSGHPSKELRLVSYHLN